MDETLQIIESGTMLPLMEAFYTIQGEGFNSGKAAYFIRLAGCDVGCPWCDVKESWDASQHQLTSIAQITSAAAAVPSSAVVITGGEPLIYNLGLLCKTLKAAGKTLLLETSGAYPLSGSFDWICVSPKKFKPPLASVAAAANELKVIVFNKSDFAWGERHAATVGAGCKLFLQPEWSNVRTMMPLVVDYVKSNPQWEISIQTHKYMNIP